VHTYRRVALVVIVAVVAFGVYHALISYEWSGPLDTPTGVAAKYVDFTCGPPWGTAYVHGPTSTPYRIEGTPCGQREEYRVMTVIDVVIGGIAFALIAGWSRRVRSQPTAA
jgi:hypothetical protein